MRNIQIPAALALVTDEKGNYLITLRNDQANKQTHMKWEIPGGSIKFGETPRDAAIRETKEEIGLDIELVRERPLVKSWVWKYPKKHVHVVLITYICRAPGEQKVVIDTREIIDFQWITPSKIDSLDYLPHLDTLILEADALLHS